MKKTEEPNGGFTCQKTPKSKFAMHGVKSLFVVICLLLVQSFACSGQPDGKYTLRLKILQSQTKKPIGEVAVQVFSVRQQERDGIISYYEESALSGLADSKGAFDCQLSSTVSYYITFYKEGFRPAPSWLTFKARPVAEGESVSVEVWMMKEAGPEMEGSITVEGEWPSGNLPILLREQDNRHKVVLWPNSEQKVRFRPLQDGVTYLPGIAAEGFYTDRVSAITCSRNQKYPFSLHVRSIQVGQKIPLASYFFDVNDTRIQMEKGMAALEEMLEIILRNPSFIFEIACHTDSRGDAQYNMELTQKQAEEIMRYLVSKGANPDGLLATGYGESQLVNECTDGVKCDTRKHQQNRRIELVVKGRR